MIMAYVPRERICFDKNASLNFHLPQVDNRESALAGGRYMLNKYPEDIRLWLHERGGVEAMPHKDGWWILSANDLWAMGYQRCEEEGGVAGPGSPLWPDHRHQEAPAAAPRRHRQRRSPERVYG